MELGYAFFLLLTYVILVLLGIFVYEYRDTWRKRRQPLQLPMMTDQEKNHKLNELLKPVGFAYDSRQDIFYSRMDSWQRKFGYGRIYDEAAAPLNMIIDCEPVYFEYEDKKWLIEFWKGQYGITTGGEVGVYYLPKRTLAEEILEPELVYRAVEDEEMLRIQTVLWKNGRRLYYRRGYHWWLTGFVLGEYASPRELELDIELTFPNAPMRDAFLEGLHRAGYEDRELNVQGNVVWIHFSKPHTRQPMTRTRLISAVKQMENRCNCRLYRRVTGNYDHTYEKLLVLKRRAPGLYRKWEQLGRSRFLNGEE